MPFYHSYSGLVPETADARPIAASGRASSLRASGPSADLFARTVRRYARPTFGLSSTVVSGVRVPVSERSVAVTPFWSLTAFDRLVPDPGTRFPRVLLLPPLAGHCPTLVRDTVAALLPGHAVFVANWSDARGVPLTAGAFGLAEAVDAVMAMARLVGSGCHIVAVTEAGAPAIAAAIKLGEQGVAPPTLALIGGPIDCRADHAGLAAAAAGRGLDWFVARVIAPVPPSFPGAYREVFPGFFALTDLLTVGLHRPFVTHMDLFERLIDGDGDSLEGHRDFFHEFLAVMDVPAEYFLQWTEAVLLNPPFRPDSTAARSAARPPRLAGTALMTIEAERDLFGGCGQTHAAHTLFGDAATGCRYTQSGVGRFGLFNGGRWRAEVFPRLADFIASQDSTPERPRPALAEDLQSLEGMTVVLAARLNRQGVFFVRQLAGLDGDGVAELGLRLGGAGQPVAAGLVRAARQQVDRIDRRS